MCLERLPFGDGRPPTDIRRAAKMTLSRKLLDPFHETLARHLFPPFLVKNPFSPRKRVFDSWVLVSAMICLMSWVSACVTAPQSALPTPYPTEYLPTVIALTVQAAQLTVTRLPAASSTARVTQIVSLPTETQPPTLTKTSSPSPTMPTQTPETPSLTPTRTRRPSITPTPTRTRRPTRTPTITPTPTMPFAAIQISAPGPMARLRSPIVLRASLKIASSNRVNVELSGEDGRLLVRKTLVYSAAAGTVVGVVQELDFEIAAVAETARLVISTADRYGRTVALASVDLILLSIGEEEPNPQGSFLEGLVLREPVENTLIQDGVLIASGLARPSADGMLLVELIDTHGRVVGYRQAALGAVDETGYAPFIVDVPYSVDAPTWVLLAASMNGERPGGIVHVSSLEVLLSP